MSKARPPLYGPDQAASLKRRESLRETDRRKYDLLLEHIGPCRRLADVGCGWGQFLALAPDRCEELWAVDENSARIADVRQACPRARTLVCRADRMALPDRFLDVVVTSQMLHEVKLFGHPGELERTVGEIRRVLAPGGRWLLLDHADAGDGHVVVRLPEQPLALLARFEDRYRFYKASHETLGAGRVRLSRRCLQDFLTKDWSLGSGMESLEMSETHNVFVEQPTRGLAASAGLTVLDWVRFSDIRDDLARHGGELAEGEPWQRKFLMIAQRS